MSKIVLITGATSGIGAACAFRFAKAGGYDLILTGRNARKLEDVTARVKETGCRVLPLLFDVRVRESCIRAVEQLPSEWREIDILVNNAGLALGLEPEFEGRFEDWDTMIDTNIKGLLNMTRLVVPGMVERGRGHVINIGSVAGDAAYGTKVCGTKSVPTPVRVTNVKPGLVETNFSNVRFHGDTQRASRVYEGIEPLTGDDIADVVLYAAQAPAHVQIAEVLVLATHQASGSVIHRES